MSKLNVKLHLISGAIKAHLADSEYRKLTQLASSTPATLEKLKTLDEGEVWIRGRDLVAIEMQTVRERHDPLEGFTAKDVASVTKRPYPTIVRRIKTLRDEGELEMISDRRIKPTAQNYKVLELSSSQIAQIERTNKK